MLNVENQGIQHQPSEAFASKPLQDFRNFTNGDLQDRVAAVYDLLHTNQCLDFVRGRHKKWGRFDLGRRSIMQAMTELDDLVDECDPDLDIPNSVHAYQVAERIRSVHPDKEWLILTGLIHDLGKIMALHGEPQWATVGDTFPVGCRFSETIVFGRESFKKNPDFGHPVYDSEYGIYEPHCGLDQLIMSWGHDEYMYRVLVNCKEQRLPEEALKIIRYHSFYPWHSSGAYRHLCNEEDEKTLVWINEFNKFDLYTKSETLPDVDALKPYYESLIDKFLPKMIDF